MKLCKLLLLLLAGSAFAGDMTFSVNSKEAAQGVLKETSRTPVYALTANTAYVASGGCSGVALWHIGLPGCRHVAVDSTVYSLSFGPETLYAGCGSPGVSGQLLAIDADSGTAKELTAFKEPVYAVGCDPKGQWLAAASGDGTLLIWSLPDMKEVFRQENPGTLYRSLDFSIDSKWLAVGDARGSLNLWKTEDFNLPPEQRKVQGSISAVHFSRARATTLYTACDAGIKGVTTFRADNKKFKKHNLTQFSVQGVSTAKRGSTLIAAVDQGGLRQVKGDNKKIERTYPGGDDWAQAALYFSTDRIALSAGVDGCIYVSDSWNGLPRGRLISPRADGTGWAILSSRGGYMAALDCKLVWKNEAGETVEGAALKALNRPWKVRQVLEIPPKRNNKRKAAKK